MRRLTVIGSLLCCALAAAACGSSSSTGPKDVFSGNWQGAFYNSSVSLNINLTASQNGSAVTGSGTVSAGGTSESATITGTSSAPNLRLVTIVAPGTSGDTVTFVATYITPDSVFGKVLGSAGDSLAVGGLKKH